MVAIQLDQGREEVLEQLARAEDAKPADIVRRVLEDYLDFQSLPKDDAADWAEASARLRRMSWATRIGMTNNMDRGEVWWADLPEPVGRRETGSPKMATPHRG